MSWKIKTFATKQKQDDWIAKNSRRYQITVIFVNNGYGVEYKPLKIIKFRQQRKIIMIIYIVTDTRYKFIDVATNLNDVLEICYEHYKHKLHNFRRDAVLEFNKDNSKVISGHLPTYDLDLTEYIIEKREINSEL